MALWRFIKVLLAALIIFIIVNFFISNSSPEAQSLAQQVSFKFNLPPFLNLESIDFTVGYLLILSFTLGMILTALIGGVNAFTRSRELKMKKKTILELEKEIDELREEMARDRNIMPEARLSEELNRLPDQPDIE